MLKLATLRLSSSMRWQKTASPRHCQALALENDTARQVQVFEAPVSRDGAVNRKYRPFVVW
ncbi:putative parB-like partition protein [Escherichia coli 2845650]|nr:putative parB-like partition protein [Escherichia coli 2845650]